MHKRLLLRLVVGTGLFTVGCQGVPSARDANVSFSTTPSPWPADVACLNPPSIAVAKEVMVGSTRTVVIAGGATPISDASWATYQPGFGMTKNSDRHVMFSSSCFARSPSVPADCSGDSCREIVEFDGYTWVGLSNILAVDCVPAEGGCDPGGVLPGQLAFVVTRKCHELVFTDEVYRLRGPNGIEAIMHATADGKPDVNVSLPQGYSITQEALTEPLVLHPFGGGDECYYNIIRDEKAQSYHQIGFEGATYP
jgi:hypothetical protein